MLEKNIEAFLSKKVGEKGGYCLKWTAPAETGLPDRIIIFPKGLIYFVELKRPKGGVKSAKQKVWEKRLRAKGCNYVDIKNKKEVLDFIKMVERELEKKDDQ